MSRHYIQGKFIPKNPHKYVGDVNNISYRSSWERKFMTWCDLKEAVQKWSSEEIVVPYVSPVDNQVHRYFIDFAVDVRDKNGKESKFLFEIKPEKQLKKPEAPSRITQRFRLEQEKWAVNQAKWEAAKQYAQKNGWEFAVLTEKDLTVRWIEKP